MVGWFGSNVYATQIAERKFGPLLGVLTDYKISASAISAEVNISNLTSEEFTVETESSISFRNSLSLIQLAPPDIRNKLYEPNANKT